MKPHSVKKATAKKQKKGSLTKQQWLFTGLLLLIAAGAIYVFSAQAFQFFYVQPREARIKEIYKSLDLSDEYIVQRVDIFGDKRPYEWDAGRSYSSSQTYVRGGTVKDTMAALDVTVKRAGFSFIDEPYAGSLGSMQYHYKSDKGEYVRVSVDSKPRSDAFQNYSLMHPGSDQLPQELFEIDPNSGPVNVTIKVNLDDNNE